MQLFRLSVALMLVVLVQVGAVAATCAGCALQRHHPPKSCGLLPHVLAYGQVHLDEHIPQSWLSWGPLAVDVTLVSTDPLGRTIHRAATRTTSELFFQVCTLLLSFTCRMRPTALLCNSYRLQDSESVKTLEHGTPWRCG